MNLSTPALRSRTPHGAGRRLRHGFTIVELLIATLISLVVMAATVSLFGVVADKITNGRAMIELSDRLRSAAHSLRTDLRGMTVDTLPWQAPAQGNGYLEIDKFPPVSAAASFNGLLGYTKDIICFTTRAKDLPFVARSIVNGQTTMIESQLAEVQWFLWPAKNSLGQPTTTPPTYTLYRHMVLVRPDFGSIPLFSYINFDTSSTGTLNYDLSAHQDVNTSNFVCNSLADLAYREFRFNHVPYQYPFSLAPSFPQPVPPNDPRFGEDVVLTNVLSFDVKVWDPGAAVLASADGVTPLVPGDPGWDVTKINTAISFGAYVDLNYANQLIAGSYFSGPYYGLGQKSALVNPQVGYGTYDTWCSGYEYYSHSPYSFFSSSYDVFYGTTPNATKGFDTDGANGVGDPNERTTCPPYPVPLRGVQIKIRVYEPISRQVREVTIAETFVPD
jgi:prepilin-type N-terminal cleavage/methylation domain-containing protein